MSEHLIKLRGGWTLEMPQEQSQSITLPTRWSGREDGALRLLRGFQSPPIDPTVETVHLRLEQVADLRSVELNGTRLPFDPVEKTPIEFPVTGLLQPRNQLALEVEPAGSPGDPVQLWGVVALLIRRADD